MTSLLKSAVAYHRVSSTSQLDGDGPERQHDATQRFATTRGYQIVHSFCEDISGTIGERPVFASMLAYCEEHGITTVLVESPMRFARDLAVALVLSEDCRRRGLAVIDCSTGSNLSEQSDDPISRFVHQVLFAVAELNKNIFVQMTRKARARIRERSGKCEGPKGYQERPEHQQAVDAISELWSRCKSYEHIAAELNQRGVPTIKGGAWKRGTVLCVVRRLRKAGVLA